jgi:hypothetical protein
MQGLEDNSLTPVSTHSGLSPAVSKRPILSWPPGADITADLGRFGAWIEDSHGGAVQLASDYDRRSGQLPPAWSKYPVQRKASIRKKPDMGGGTLLSVFVSGIGASEKRPLQ